MIKVMIVDDSPDFRWLIRHRIENIFKDAEFLEAEDGEVARQSLQAFDPNIIFTDYEMPVLDGPSFVKAIRAEGYDRPIVMVTGRPGAVVEGASLILSKGYLELINEDLFESFDLLNKQVEFRR